MGFDAFLQCNVEDRDVLVELATGFYNCGYRVWLDDDPTSSKIGLTLLSPSYFGTNAHDRLRDWTQAKSISGDTLEAALLAARTSPVARHLLPLWKQLRDAQVHCYSPLSFDEPHGRDHIPRATRAASARRRAVEAPARARPETQDDVKAVEHCGGCSKVLSDADYECGPGPHRWRQCSTCGHADPSSLEGLLTL
jgi:hypothetical protein